jgi:hypothetical protein
VKQKLTQSPDEKPWAKIIRENLDKLPPTERLKEIRRLKSIVQAKRKALQASK